MDAKHARHLRATDVVEALWSEQESRDATYRIASASIQDSRDEVFQIANVLPQKELSESLQPDEAHQIAQRSATDGIVGVSGTGAVTNGVSSNEGTGGETSS